MLKQDILQALQKHLGAIDTQSLEILDTQHKTHKIEKFSHEIKGINEGIGALQSLQIACQKILKLETLNAESVQELVQKAQFMGKALFNSTLSINLGESMLKLNAPSPLDLLSQGADLKAALQESLEQIKQALNTIQESVSQKQVFKKPPTLNTPSFNKDVLLDLMKSS
ncbi:MULTISPECIES: flagellar FLiS export co-chaperone [unclassified Helicobacter]|nr:MULTISPECIES: flagellar FLiS export co-chaperone [unclassified Helicobacter]